MRKIFACAAAFVLVFALSGCVTQVTKESKPSMSSVSDVSSSTASAASSASKGAVSWTSANSADEAAKGAGISGFAAADTTTIADITFKSPKFAYTDHVAQATYEEPGKARLIVRGAEGNHTAPLTERDKSEFAQSWKGTYEGVEVTSYGDKQGEIVICLWKDGNKEYGATIEGLKGSTVTMDEDDLKDIVKIVKGAAPQQAATQSQSTSALNSTPGFDVNTVVKNNKLGDFVRYYYVQGNNGKYYWAIVTRAANGSEVTSYTDEKGNIIQGGVEVGSPVDYDGADFDVAALVQANGLGQYKRYYWVQGENGTGYWGIVTIGADGAEHVTYTDEKGNIIQGGVEVGSKPDAGAAAASASNDGANFDVAAVAQNNNLGQYKRYFWVQGQNGAGYWGIVTVGADGAEHVTYTDEQGNIQQGGI